MFKDTGQPLDSDPRRAVTMGWKKNETGEWCFEGQCFKIRAGDKIELEFDETCAVDLKDAIQKGARRGTAYRIKD